jgi:hypothetical protein
LPFPWRFLLGHDSLENAQVVQRVPPEMQPITARRRAADAQVVPSSVVRQTITNVAMLAATCKPKSATAKPAMSELFRHFVRWDCTAEADNRCYPRNSLEEDAMDTTTLLIILIVVLLLFGGGFYGRGRWW